MYKFLVRKKMEGVFGGSKCSKMLKNAIFTHLTPQKNPKKIFWPKINRFPFFGSMFGLKLDIFKSEDINGKK